jgi:hypothetical protein
MHLTQWDPLRFAPYGVRCESAFPPSHMLCMHVMHVDFPKDASNMKTLQILSFHEWALGLTWGHRQYFANVGILTGSPLLPSSVNHRHGRNLNFSHEIRFTFIRRNC